jgi:rhodanese-related sulfurtransferase
MLVHGMDDELTPGALAERLRGGRAPVLIDVREPFEWGISHLPGARLMPLGDLPGCVETLDPLSDYVVYCHHGIRSAAAVAWLRHRGFTQVRNLSGGIDRWSREVDPSVRRY